MHILAFAVLGRAGLGLFLGKDDHAINCGVLPVLICALHRQPFDPLNREGLQLRVNLGAGHSDPTRSHLVAFRYRSVVLCLHSPVGVPGGEWGQ